MPKMDPKIIAQTVREITVLELLGDRWVVYVEKTEAVTTLCRTIATNLKSIALRRLDGQLKSGACEYFCVNG